MTGAVSIALSGMTAAATKAAKAAANIVNAGAQNVEAVSSSDPSHGIDYTRDIVDLKEAATAYKANVAVAKVSNEMEKELFSRFDETV